MYTVSLGSNPALVKPMAQIFNAVSNGDLVKALALLKKHEIPEPEWQLECICGFIQFLKDHPLHLRN